MIYGTDCVFVILRINIFRYVNLGNAGIMGAES